jgi:hypothetical protein
MLEDYEIFDPILEPCRCLAALSVLADPGGMGSSSKAAMQGHTVCNSVVEVEGLTTGPAQQGGHLG